MLGLWEQTVGRRRDKPAVHYLGTTHTYGQLDDVATALAAAFADAGVVAGDRVGIMLQNDPQWVIALVATWKVGGIAVSFSPMLKSRETRAQIDDAGVVAMVLLDDLYRDVLAQVLPGSTVRTVFVTSSGEWSGAGPIPDPADPDVCSLLAAIERNRGRTIEPPTLTGPDIGILVYTSGTTGPPKGAMLTHAGLSHNSQLPADWFGLDATDTVLGIAPLFHVTGLVMHMGLAWFTGAALVLGHRFDAHNILLSIERHRPTFTIAAITAFTALLAYPEFEKFDLSSLRIVASGGAPVTLGVVDRFRRATGCTIVSVYGLTETTSPSHLTPPGSAPPVDPDSGALAVGVPVPGSVAEVVAIDSAEPLPAGSVGEIVISGPMVVPGYWGKPEQSAATIRAGRLFTGDVGLMTEDGWFFIVDRKKDLIVASGYKVWPREVEEVLYEHPSVSEAAVVGEPDEYRGETVAAWVVPHANASVEPDELIAFCRERLAAYKYPRRVHVVAEIPKTTSGKILRRELRGRPS
jgi:long-chain acyl-CoA synthetase